MAQVNEKLPVQDDGSTGAEDEPKPQICASAIPDRSAKFSVSSQSHQLSLDR